MYFVRLSQCPVGGPKGICTAWDGHTFTCDTGASYKKPEGSPEWHSYNEIREQFSPAQIMEEVDRLNIDHICLTGGEPLVYGVDISTLIRFLKPNNMVHIETSGTEMFSAVLPHKQVWITMSPKDKWLKSMALDANEFKLLVHQKTKPSDIDMWTTVANGRPVYLQPLDDEHAAENQTMAIELAKKTNTRLSIQIHKKIGVR